MRILFMGTPDFAAASLLRLLEDGQEICGVFCQPDRAKNRGMKLAACPVKEVAQRHGLPVMQPERLRDGRVMDQIRAWEPDLIAVVAYGKFLPEEILVFPRYGCINLHGSLLPKYRGSAPIQWAVLNGEKVTGVTTLYMTAAMDAGDIIDTVETQIGETETAGELFGRLQVLGAELLARTVRNIEAGVIVRIPQDETQVTFAPPLSRTQSPIDWTQPSDRILCQIRGLNPWPAATMRLRDAVFKVYSAGKSALFSGGRPGEILAADGRGLHIACGDGAVEIGILQAPGGKRMPAVDYLRGHPLV